MRAERSVEPAATTLVPADGPGRRYTAEATVRLGDTDPAGRLRLDAVARHLQDVANDDAIAAGLANADGWVVRRTLVEVARPPELGERLRLTTFCSGTGRSWAERRTSIAGDRGGRVEAVSAWIQVDPSTGRPLALGDDFHRIYGESAGGRRVSTRLALPAPPADATIARWSVRHVDLDVFGHVNNAVAWAVVHEVRPDGLGAGRGQVEYAAPLDPGPVELRWEVTGDPTEARPAAVAAWLVAGDAVRVAARWEDA